MSIHCSTCYKNWPDYEAWHNHQCTGHDELSALNNQLEALKAAYERIQLDAARWDEERNQLKERLAAANADNQRLLNDRRAFAEETQKYRDAWLKDQVELSELRGARSQALEDAAKVADEEAQSEGRWGEQYFREGDLNKNRECVGGFITGKLIAEEIRALASQRKGDQG